MGTPAASQHGVDVMKPHPDDAFDEHATDRLGIRRFRAGRRLSIRPRRRPIPELGHPLLAGAGSLVHRKPRDREPGHPRRVVPVRGRQSAWWKGEWVDEFVYAILAREWSERRSSG
jgi:hypothetical protein